MANPKPLGQIKRGQKTWEQLKGREGVLRIYRKQINFPFKNKKMKKKKNLILNLVSDSFKQV